MTYDLRKLTQRTINELHRAQEIVAKQCIIDRVVPMDHIHFYWLTKLERQIKDYIEEQESYRKE